MCVLAAFLSSILPLRSRALAAARITESRYRQKKYKTPVQSVRTAEGRSITKLEVYTVHKCKYARWPVQKAIRV